MGSTLSFLRRPLRRYNIENRAHKIISKEKPTPSPEYEATKKQREVVDKLFPGFKEQINKRDIVLDKYLKDVFVTSAEAKENVEDAASQKPLPQRRSRFQASGYSADDPSLIPPGKCTLIQAFQFIKNHKEDPETHTINKIASDYKLDKQVVEHILKHFKLIVLINKSLLLEKHGETVQDSSAKDKITP